MTETQASERLNEFDGITKEELEAKRLAGEVGVAEFYRLSVLLLERDAALALLIEALEAMARFRATMSYDAIEYDQWTVDEGAVGEFDETASRIRAKLSAKERAA